MTTTRSVAHRLSRVAVVLAFAAVLGTSLITSAAYADTFTVEPNPLVGGTYAVGQTLTAVTGSWSPQPDSFTYQWFADGIAIDGATGQTYTPTLDVLCLPLTVQVTASRAGYDPATTQSDPTPLIEPIADVTDYAATGGAGVTGTPVVGHALTATTGSWSPAPEIFGYQWFADGDPIGGATGSSYLLTSADLGKSISVAVTGFTQFYNAVTATSTPTAAITQPFASTATPSITGSPTVGETLSAVPGTWGPTPDSFAYQWYADDAPITGSVGATYSVTADVVGKKISVRVTGSKAGYQSDSATSSQTAAVTEAGLLGFVSVPTPSITGAPIAGEVLSAFTGAWSPTPDSFTYQWFADDEAIVGASGSTYGPTADVVGKRISVRVTATKSGYTSAGSTSAQSAVVVGVFSSAPLPKISGAAKIGKTLKVVVGTWVPQPTFTYQWYANGKKIARATKATLKLAAAQKGKKITVYVTATKPGYTAQISHSAATAKVK